jgi:hypothetical protein
MTRPYNKHGGTGTKLYGIWIAMRDRCENLNNPAYSYYGGRGIEVCDRWQEFQNFRGDMGKRPSLLHTVDRINNDGNYEPGNCRWVTRKIQQNNRRGLHHVTYNGVTKNVTSWAEQLGISPSVLNHRLNRGWSVKVAFETPNLGRGRRASMSKYWKLDKRAA